MDTELSELCKEVFNRTGWKTGRHIWSLKRPVVCKGDDFMDGMSFPLYTSDYLLEKLPARLDQGELFVGKWGQSYWRAGYFNYAPAWSDLRDFADTPLKALLKLVIALDDAGELA